MALNPTSGYVPDGTPKGSRGSKAGSVGGETGHYGSQLRAKNSSPGNSAYAGEETGSVYAESHTQDK